MVKVQQNGVWSNGVSFSMTSLRGSGPSVTLVPAVISMVVGDTRSLQALDPNNQSVTGLTWSSSDTTIATLSTDDPPIITAVAPGTVTIFAGNASADLTVYPGPTLPIGTVQWSNPGDGSGIVCCALYPAVPSATGVADIFAMNQSGNVQALRSDGTVAWTTNVASPSSSFPYLLPDFQGGLTLYGSSPPDSGSFNAIYKLDGMTGQPYPPYIGTSNEDQNIGGIGYPAIHTDGTIFTLDYSCSSTDCTGSTDSVTRVWVVGIDPSTGNEKFKVAAANSTSAYTLTGSDTKE